MFSFVFTRSAPNLYAGKIYLIYLVESPEQKKLQCNFHQPMSRMLTEDDDYCFQLLVGEAGRDTIV